jgi:hypothetical protein
MPLSLNDLQRIATDVAREEDPSLEVVAAANAEGAADYSEVILTVHRPDANPSPVIIGVTRSATEPEVRRLLRGRLREVRQSTPAI